MKVLSYALPAAILFALLPVSTASAFLIPPSTASIGHSRSSVIPLHRTSYIVKFERRPGIASPEELTRFVDKAGDSLLVIDLRNPADTSGGGSDLKFLDVGPIPSEKVRPLAKNLVWDHTSGSMPLPSVPKDTPIITHCNSGGRGRKAKDFLTENGYTNVVNGGGPADAECWKEFGDK